MEDELKKNKIENMAGQNNKSSLLNKNQTPQVMGREAPNLEPQLTKRLPEPENYGKPDPSVPRDHEAEKRRGGDITR